MRLCFVVDYRSPIARNWIGYFVRRGYETHVVSTFSSAEEARGLASYHFIPVGLSGLASNPRLRRYGGATEPVEDSRRLIGQLGRRLGQCLSGLRPWFAPVGALFGAKRLRATIEALQPDLVHAMRLPFEGILAAHAVHDLPVPLVISVWGNDFTLYCADYPPVGWATEWTLRRTTALHTDCKRDARLATAWGFDPRKPTMVIPGGGGVQPEIFFRGQASKGALLRWKIPPRRPIVVNARGIRPKYVRTDVFFAAIPLVLAECSDVLFVCVGMKGNPVAESLRMRHDIARSVRLLPTLSRAEMGELFRLADVMVSPSIHDGTPNTLLEGMACGALPVVGDIDSVREWVRDGENGLLCDPTSATSVAWAIVAGLRDIALRKRAAEENARIVLERAEYYTSMTRAERFYCRLVGHLRTPLGTG